MKTKSQSKRASVGIKNLFSGIKGIGVICFVVSLIMVIHGMVLQPKINKNKAEIAVLEAEIEEINEKKAEVDRLSTEADSDEYIEKIARDRLGMVKKDEVVFIDVSEKQ